jgi:hypothetical protein
VNEPSHRVTAHQPQQPQNDQYYSNRPQHYDPPFSLFRIHCRLMRPAPANSDPPVYLFLDTVSSMVRLLTPAAHLLSPPLVVLWLP